MRQNSTYSSTVCAVMSQDFHNTAKKIHITHLKLASNLSINRRRLEIIRTQQRMHDKTMDSTNNKIDDIWLNQHNEDIQHN